MKPINHLKELISRGEADAAIEQLNLLLQDCADGERTVGGEEIGNKDTFYYLLGNAYRKKGDWKRALDNYQYAIDLNPAGPAAEARAMVIDILNFYHKDMYNQ